MNILYLHGYGSSGQSSTVEYLKSPCQITITSKPPTFP